MKFLQTANNDYIFYYSRYFNFFFNYNYKENLFFFRGTNNSGLKPFRDYFVYIYFFKKKFIKPNNILKKKLLDYSGSEHKNDFNYKNIFIKCSLLAGNKLSMIKRFNYFHDSFYFLFNEKNQIVLSKFSNYEMYFDLSLQNLNFFNINTLFESIFFLNHSIFNLRVVRINKVQKKLLKNKSKFNFDVVYLPKAKRIRNLIKLIHVFSNHFNHYNYYERLLMSFSNSLFLQKNSYLYKRKIFMYKNAFSTKISSKLKDNREKI